MAQELPKATKGGPVIERRKEPFMMDEAKFSTQRLLTFFVISITALVTAWVLFYGSTEQRSAIVQMWIGLTIGAVMYWIGTTKSSADNGDRLSRLITPPSIAAMTANTEATMANTAANTAATVANTAVTAQNTAATEAKS